MKQNARFPLGLGKLRNVFVTVLVLFSVISLTLIINFIYDSNNSKTKLVAAPTNLASTTPKNRTADRIVLSIVACDSRLNEALTLIKSVLLFTKSPVYFIIFADDNLLPQFDLTLTRWNRKLTSKLLEFELRNVTVPEERKSYWLNLFSKCASQKLFIPLLLPHIDAIIYVDTDTIFLGPVDELWGHFNKFNSTQMSAVALEEDENPHVFWYPRFAQHPFYGKYGINSGVMLMNLTRMRTFGWEDYVTPTMLQWKLHIPWGDQDIINIIFHYHPEAVYILSCRYNYRSDQCMYGDACADGTRRGVLVLHGSRQIFHNNRQPAFRAMYTAISEYQVGTPPANLVSNMQKYLDEGPQTDCARLKDAFIKVPQETLLDLYGRTGS